MTDNRPETSLPLDSAANAMRTARGAFARWRTVPTRQRAAAISALLDEVLRAREEIVQTICKEAGKTPFEALTSDVLATLEILRYLVRHGPALLRPCKRPTPFLLGPGHSRVEYRPRGVVEVIAPWNNPFQLALVPAATALIAGNAVILKPSERAPATGNLIKNLCARAGFPEGLLQVMCGGAEVATSLIESGPDMVFFTGGTEHGRAVAAAAGQRLIPTVLELGGKDPMIVFSDADLERAASAAVYGAFAHAGQHCVSVKRLFVEDAAYDSFLDRVSKETQSVSTTGQWGGPSHEGACKAAQDQVMEAIAAGAKLRVPVSPNRVGAEPTLVADVAPGMRLMRVETFAPVLAAARFTDEAQAIRLANDSPYGLNASVWTRDPARAERVTRDLEAGNIYVNGVLVNIGNPHLPFGGVKLSGLGRYHGPEGVRAFCTETSVMVGTSRRRAEPMWFPHDATKRATVERLMELRYGKPPLLARIAGWAVLLRKR